MIFRDPLYGEIKFYGTPYFELIYELLNCPEVQRLRHVRLMNYDVPFIQDLAAIKRLPHSLGTCFITYQIVESSTLSLQKKMTLIAAALLHDIGILPYGHLLEFVIKKRDPQFSHQKLVYAILSGSYHPSNKYHQILPSASLKLSDVLKRFSIDQAELFNLICPNANATSAISGDIDVDNIDNIHRMAYFLGYSNIQENVKKMMNGITINKNYQLVFNVRTIDNIIYWLTLRQKIYTIIIAHPYCVAYNSYLNILLGIAIDNGIINAYEWYLTDNMLEEKLLRNDITYQLATQLYSKNQFELLDYIWITSDHKPSNNLKEIEQEIFKTIYHNIENKSDLLINHKSELFIWSEKKIISKELEIIFNDDRKRNFGFDSYSILISAVKKRESGIKPLSENISKKNKWRNSILECIHNQEPNWDYIVSYPEAFQETFPPLLKEQGQIELFN